MALSKQLICGILVVTGLAAGKVQSQEIASTSDDKSAQQIQQPEPGMAPPLPFEMPFGVPAFPGAWGAACSRPGDAAEKSSLSPI